MGQSQDAVEFIAMQGSGSGVRIVGTWIQVLGRSSRDLEGLVGAPMAVGGSGYRSECEWGRG